MKKVLYFTAGDVPTGAELTAIGKLNAATSAPYEVGVRNTLHPAGDTLLEHADYVAGTIPTAYNAVTEIDPNNIPDQSLSATQAVIDSGVDIVVPVTGVYATKITPTIVAGVITGFVLG